MYVSLSNEEALKLLKKISKKDEAAFHKLYEKTNKMVYFYLLRLIQNEHIAEEVMIKTFTQVWESAKTFKEQSKVTTWIVGIARNMAMKEFKDIKKHGSHNDINDYKHIADNGFIPSDFSDKKEFVIKALDKLSLKHREILDMFFFCEMSYNDIAYALDVSLNTVKSRIFYAKKELKKILSEMGISEDEL